MTWIPHYLTWPWWADHDVHATMALGWDRGVLPYRDLVENNFPGTMYLFWILGRLVGWGWSPALYALDSLMVLAFGVVTLVWSVRRLGHLLPGLIGYTAFLSYYLSLDYSLAAQRDWHGPFFAVTALLVADTWPGRAGRCVSALGVAVGFTIRPQVVLLLPAFAVALIGGIGRSGEPKKPVRVLLEWGLIFAFAVCLCFVPLFYAGIFGDFLHGIRLAAYGSSYNRVGVIAVLHRMLLQFIPFAAWSVPAAVALLASRSQPSLWRSSRIWLVALLGVAFHGPLSPIPAPYLNHPMRMVWSMNLALVAALILHAKTVAPRTQLALILCLVAVTGMTPRFCDPERSIEALKSFNWRTEPTKQPLGYTHGYRRKPYPWGDYCRTLAYLRSATLPGTRVANALKHDPALTAPAARLPVFPAESLAWVRMVKPDDGESFVRALESATDSVVVWAPSEADNGETPTIPALFALIPRLYEFEAKFGLIEVWRRKAPAREPNTER